MKGRKPKPAEIRRLEGNPGHRPLPEPVHIGGRPIAEIPEPPEALPADARDAWHEVVPRLQEVGILDHVDRLALEAMCVQWARAKQAGKVVAREGLIALGSTGQFVEHPALNVERQAHQMFLKFAEHYALTPIARTRLGLAELQRRSLAQEMAASLDDALIEVE
jgi:P27 family predicted phage terminase small subunit